jgi:hypothetical protein
VDGGGKQSNGITHDDVPTKEWGEEKNIAASAAHAKTLKLKALGASDYFIMKVVPSLMDGAMIQDVEYLLMTNLNPRLQIPVTVPVAHGSE